MLSRMLGRIVDEGGNVIDGGSRRRVADALTRFRQATILTSLHVRLCSSHLLVVRDTPVALESSLPLVSTREMRERLNLGQREVPVSTVGISCAAAARRLSNLFKAYLISFLWEYWFPHPPQFSWYGLAS